MANVYQWPSITRDLAHRRIPAADKKVVEIGQSLAIAIVDESGILKVFSRLDGAALLAVQHAQDKAPRL